MQFVADRYAVPDDDKYVGTDSHNLNPINKMEKGTFTPPQVVEIEGILVKATMIADKNILELIIRDAISGQLRTVMSGIKALGLNTVARGANVLAVCESRISGVTQYVNELKTTTTHERTGLSLSHIINLDEGDDVDFAALNPPSEEP